MALLSELKRRNVLRVGTAYLVTAWLVVQVVETVFPVYGLSQNAIRYVITALVIGLVPALIFAWVFELTPEGLMRDKDVDRSRSVSLQTGKTLDRTIMIVLALAVGYFAFDKFVLSESREVAIAESARQEGRTEALVGSYGDHSIAVLPFVDMSPGNDQEYMSDGIAEELLNLLAKIPELRVISRSSAFAFKGKDIDIPTVAEQLNVAHILEGSVRKAGNRLRITAQLIQAQSDTHLWSETYDRELVDIFEIQDEIAATVVDELKLALLGNVPTTQKIDEEAYTLVLQARYFWNRRAEGDEQAVLEMYKRAIEIDPNYAPAWAGLSVAYAVHANKGRMDETEGLALAQAAAEKSLQLDPDLSDAHVRMGQAYARAGNRDAMRVEYRKALALDPNSPLAIAVIAMDAGRNGRFDEAIKLYMKAESLDPLGAIWPGNMARPMIHAGRYEDAERKLHRSFELNGNLKLYRSSLVDIHILRKEYTEALELLPSIIPELKKLIVETIAYHGLGRVEEADAALSQCENWDPETPYYEFWMALLYAQLGESDKAFEWLHQINDVPISRIRYDPLFRGLHSDPRWQPYIDDLASSP
jgi:TolB-like protein/Tfp pilus assembly protein PilF